MQTFNQIKPTINADKTRRRTVLAISTLAVFVLSLTITLVAVSMWKPEVDNIDYEPVGSTAVVMDVPVPEYLSMLKNCSMTNLQYNATLKRWEAHKAVTLETPREATVRATYDGTVISTTPSTIYGQQVVIQHRDGLQTVYSNLDGNLEIRNGQAVTRGQVIGKVGATSSIEYTSIPHLRVEILRNGKKVDPNNYIDFPIK